MGPEVPSESNRAIEKRVYGESKKSQAVNCRRPRNGRIQAKLAGDSAGKPSSMASKLAIADGHSSKHTWESFMAETMRSVSQQLDIPKDKKESCE